MARGFRSIHNRLFLLFLFCMLSLLLVMSGLYYKRSTDQIQEKISDIAQKNISQTVALFDLLLKGYDSVTKSLNSNVDLLRLLAEPVPNNSALHVINGRTITNILGAIYYSREDILGIHVITYSGSIYSYENSLSVIDLNYAETDWYRELKQSTGEMKWFGVYPKSVIDSELKQPVHVFGRQLYDLTEHKPVGIVLIETDPRPILSALNNVSLGPHSSAFIYSKDGRVIASGPQTSDQQDPPPRVTELPGSGQAVVKQAGRLIVSAKPAMADWTVVGITPDPDLSVELDRNKQFLLMVISILVVVSTALASFVSRSFSSPFKRLIHQMKQVERGNFKGLVNVNSYEEINILVSSFNQMVNRMDELIERVKLSSISEKNAQLQALHTQVNPHFLYNTLDMVYWMLDERENDRLGKVILSLSHLFRYSSHWDETSKVSLREELEQIRHYLTIIETRLSGRLATDIRVQEDWLSVPLPKMTLQPIIENAVKHGLEPLNRPGLLRVYTQTFEQGLQVIIEDNGTGMEEEELDRLKESLSLQEAAGSVNKKYGIGLQNLHRRLTLLYGDAYGLRICSRPGCGTTVTVSVPIPAEGGDKNDEHSHR